MYLSIEFCISCLEARSPLCQATLQVGCTVPVTFAQLRITAVRERPGLFGVVAGLAVGHSTAGVTTGISTVTGEDRQTHTVHEHVDVQVCTFTYIIVL